MLMDLALLPVGHTHIDMDQMMAEYNAVIKRQNDQIRKLVRAYPSLMDREYTREQLLILTVPMSRSKLGTADAVRKFTVQQTLLLEIVGRSPRQGQPDM